MPQWGLPWQPHPLDLAEVFGRDAPRILEIGFGMGETTAQIAAAAPETDFIGVEVYTAGCGALLRRIADQQLTNLRIIQHDAMEVVRDMIQAATLDRIQIFFPDPWPKARHHKRRLIRPDFVEELANRLKPGGILHCATDWAPYADVMREVLSASPTLSTQSTTPDGFAPRPAYRPLTRFESRGLRLGHEVFDLVYQRTTNQL
jgi:tRNA (guanine-N7-)-methyltransferase